MDSLLWLANELQFGLHTTAEDSASFPISMRTDFMKHHGVAVVPLGCLALISLRVEGQRGELSYIGHVYIHDYIHGEALESGKPLKVFTLH